MIELVRFIDKIDKEDVAIVNPSVNYDVYDSGDWLVPVGKQKGSQTIIWQEATDADKNSQGNPGQLSAEDIRMARLVWMEKGRTDAKAIGKFTVIRGESTRIKTDRYDKNKLGQYKAGMLLTVKASTLPADGGKFVLAPLDENAGDSVPKAICYEAPANSDDLITFELVN